MRRFDSRVAVVAITFAGVAAAFAVVATSTTACVVALDDEFDASANDAGADAAPLVHGCLPFHDVTSLVALSGIARSIDLDGRESLWWFDTAKLGASTISNAGIVTTSARLAPGCAWSNALTPSGAPRSIVASSPLAAGDTLALLDAVVTPRGAFAYYALYEPDPSATFGIRGAGYGIAARDASGVFQSTSAILWTSDRPSYGSAVIATTDFVYVYGCKSAGFLSDDCFVARASLASDLASPGSYAYDVDGMWSSNADDARPIARAGPSLSVKWIADVSRYVMTYVTPLGRDIRMRSALTPEGPWSGEIVLARCDLAGADPDAFCTGAAQHPEVQTTHARSIAVSYGVASFSMDVRLPPDAYWPKLVEIDLPADVP